MKILQIATLFSILLFINAFGQTGGAFEIRQSVVASGGGQNSGGGAFAVGGTVGQPAAGTNSGGGVFGVSGGFWFPQLAPTAANVAIGGRILAADGRGIRNVIISLTDTSGGQIRTARSGSFGYYRFEEIPVGETYILTVRSKRFTFLPETRIITLLNELTDLDFTAQP